LAERHGSFPSGWDATITQKLPCGAAGHEIWPAASADSFLAAIPTGWQNCMFGSLEPAT
jgi:hypothetical protein